jgi:hypothetical protein
MGADHTGVVGSNGQRTDGLSQDGRAIFISLGIDYGSLGGTYAVCVLLYECDLFISLASVTKAQSREFRLLWTRHSVIETDL